MKVLDLFAGTGVGVAAKPAGLPMLRPVPAEPGCGRALVPLAEDDPEDIIPRSWRSG